MSVRGRDGRPREPLRRGADRRRARARRRAARGVRRTPPRAAGRARASARPSSTRAARSTSSRDAASARRLAGRARPPRSQRPARRDHRADRPQDGHQRAQLGRARLHGRLRGLQLAHLGATWSAARSTCADADPGHDRARRSRRQATTALDDDPAMLLVRPRGWHLPERHLAVDGEPVAGALVDFALFVHRNAARAAGARRGAVPLPARSSSRHLEARAVERRFELRRGGARPRRAARSRRPC